MPQIHPTSVVSPESELADDVVIGPYCFLTGRVKLGAGVRLMGNNYLNGPVTMGARTIVYPFACLGFEPQDVKFKPGMTTAGVEIGADCIIREYVTIHASTSKEVPTRLGDRAFMMITTHIAHDCQVGNDATFVYGAGVAGHAVLGNNVTLGGSAVIHQFCRIGRMVMMSGDCGVSLDVPPFCVVNERNRIGGINQVGLRRSGMPREHITELRRAFRDVLRSPMPRKEAVAILRDRAAETNCPPLLEMAEFIAASKRGITPGMGKLPRGMGRVGAAATVGASLNGEDAD